MSPTLRSRRDVSAPSLVEARITNKDERTSNEGRNSMSMDNNTSGGSSHLFNDRPSESPDPHLLNPSEFNETSFSRNHSIDEDSQDVDDEEFSFKNSIRIANLDKINYPGLIKDMYGRFKKKAETWERNARNFSRWSFFLNFLILFMQMMQMVIAQFIDIFDVTTRFAQALQCLLAAVAGLFVGLQMKLKLLQKAEKYRRGAKVYGRLRRTSAYYLMLLENGGKVEDITLLWKEAMKQESRNVPTVKTFMVT